MTSKAIFPKALALAIFGAGSLHAQVPGLPAPANEPAATKPSASDSAPAAAPADRGDPAKPVATPNPALPDVLPATTGQPQMPLSPWIAYSRPECCGNVGADGVIGNEYYWRTGASIPVAGGAFYKGLNTGWMNSWGMRSLFFNPEGTSAWNIDLGISYTWNSGSPKYIFDQEVGYSITDPLTGLPQAGQVNTPVSLRSYQRTSVDLGIGREWYLMGSARTPGNHLRWGIDNGGRWGASHAVLNNFGQLNNPEPGVGYARLYDVYGAYFIALHSDVEIPFNCCCTFFAGWRAEWNYNWSDIFSSQKGDLQDVNLMLQFGVRY